MSNLDGIPIQKRFGAALKDVRVERGLSQEQLAELAGVHRTYVGSVERGERNVSLVNIDRLAGALGLHTCQLFARVEATAVDGSDKHHSGVA